MEATAVTRHIRQSPRKIRKTLDAVRRQKVGVALNVLHFSPEKAATVIEKTLRSAVANMMVAVEGSSVDPETLTIKSAYVDGGPAMRRFRASAMGRASRIRRRSSHLTITVTDEQK